LDQPRAERHEVRKLPRAEEKDSGAIRLQPAERFDKEGKEPASRDEQGRTRAEAGFDASFTLSRREIRKLLGRERVEATGLDQANRTAQYSAKRGYDIGSRRLAEGKDAERRFFYMMPVLHGK
jgi:hypothetical protein